MKMKSLYLALVLFVSVCLQATAEHDVRTFPSPIQTGEPLSIAGENLESTAIVIRYLGYNCAHCVRQLVYLNEHAKALHNMGIKVIASSPDAPSIWSKLVREKGLDTTLFRYFSDADGKIATVLGAVRTENDTLWSLHAAYVIRAGRVVFSVISTEPYMDIESIVHSAAPVVLKPAAVSPAFIDRYLEREPVATVVASAADGIREPLDLDFNRSVLHPNDLWVVTSERGGHAIAILHQAGTPNQSVRLKKDSRASHFMWRTMAIAMGSNGAFATAQNGQPGNGDLDYMFMGPTLWSSDTAVFASRYQGDNQRLASHLDMLHQSPWCLGIAHDTANVYWVLDAKYKDICRYDFRDPHEVGGTDHRDGIIRRYSDVGISAGERGRPSHMALDKATGWLYYVDPGKNAVYRLDTRSGTNEGPLVAPPESDENYAEYSLVTGARVESVVTNGLLEPIGIEIVENRLLVGDKGTGHIHVYALSTEPVTFLGTIATGATDLTGIVVGPDGRIWCCDRSQGVILRLDTRSDNSLESNQRVVVSQPGDTLNFLYTNVSANAHEVRVTTRMLHTATGAWTPWSDPLVAGTAEARDMLDVEVPFSSTDSLTTFVMEVAEVDASGVRGITATVHIVPYNVRRAIVQDERVGTFDINEAVGQTNRTGYVLIPSDVFTQSVDSMHVLKTVLWNSGSFGEIDAVDDAIIASLLRRKIEIFLIADDPLILRTDLPNSFEFYSAFGVSMRGVDVEINDRGQRVFKGVVGDPITAGMTSIDCQLPRLDHHRGGRYIPNITFRVSGSTASRMLTRKDTIVGAVRNETLKYRTIILGIHSSRFLDGEQRTQILDKGLAWLELAAEPDSIPTSVNDVVSGSTVQILLGTHPIVQSTSWELVGTESHNVVIEVYSVAGQHIRTLYSGSGIEARGTIESSHYTRGTYFLIARVGTDVVHRTIIVR